MMNSKQTDLYHRLQNFQLDDLTDEFGFTHHLIKNQGWTIDYAIRAIEEYKKFTFLAVFADHQVVPSDQVDQVWHAHILCTKSYWEEFCPIVLQKNLHHHQARGGKEERARFHQLYLKTIESYRYFFGEPPVELWSPAHLRFGAEIKQQRVNLASYWIIPKKLPNLLPKLGFSRSSLAAIIIGFVMVGCVRNIHPMGESYYPDSEEVIAIWDNIERFLYVSISLIIGFVIRYQILKPNSTAQKPKLDSYEVAYLVGDGLRAVDLAITQLVYQGYLRPNVTHKSFTIEKNLPSSAHYLEQEVMQQIHKMPELRKLRSSVMPTTKIISQQLIQKKLLMSKWAAFISRSFIYFLISTLGLPFIILLAIVVLSPIVFILDKLSIQLNFYAIWGSLVLISLCTFVPSQKTSLGSYMLTDIKKNYDIHRLPQNFAVNGSGILSGGILDDLKEVFSAVELEECIESSSGGGCGC
jgi:uncharacterized protein (TIGR04222 family)